MTEKEKSKIVFFSVVGLIILFMVFYAYHLYGGKEETATVSSSHIIVPEAESKEVYKTKLEAIRNKKEANKTNAPSVYDEAMLALEKQNVAVNVEYHSNEDSLKIVQLQEEINRLKSQKTPTRRRVRSAPKKTTYMAVEATVKTERRRKEGFSSTSTTQKSNDNNNYAIQINAVVVGDQIVRDQGRVKVRTTKDVQVENHHIPTGTILYCIASVSSNTIYLNLHGINKRGNLIPVNLTAYSFSGTKGFNVKSNLGTQAKNETINEALGEVTRNSRLGRRISGVFRSNDRDQGVTVSNGLKMILR